MEQKSKPVSSTFPGSVSGAMGGGERVGPPPLPPKADPALKWLMPVGRSGWAIAAGYLGLLSVLMVFAPVALVVGVIALNDLKKKPRLGGKGRAVFGLVMGGIFTVIFVVVLLSVWLGR